MDKGNRFRLMSTAVRFTADQFDRMVASGVFEASYEPRIELIFGELREMPPPGLLLSIF